MALIGATPAAARPALVVASNCAYSGDQFAVAGIGFAPNERATIDVMSTADPLAGAPLSSREVTARPDGGLNVLLEAPPTDGTRRVRRSVRIRSNPDPSLGMPTLLASAPLMTVSRGVTVQPQGPAGSAASVERWHVTGLPDGTRMWAHYRHGAKTVARVALGAAADPCGRLRFDLRTLPRGRERRGAWDLWIVAKGAFRAPGHGVHVRRHMTVAGSGPGARVTSEPLSSRLVPRDPRVLAPETTLVRALTTQIGIIRVLLLGDARGAPVDFFERVGERLAPLGTVRGKPGQTTALEDAATWSCSRQTRSFLARTTLPDGWLYSGSDTIQTPSCARRFRISVPRRVSPGATVTVRVVDRWGNGAVRPTLCVTSPARRTSCRQLKFRSAVTIATRRFRAATRGIWQLDLRIRGSHVRTAVGVSARVGAPKAPPTLLVTGDSMMQGIDVFLADQLAGMARVRDDIRAGNGISKPTNDWVQTATRQVARLHPRNTAIMIGGSDGFWMTTPEGERVNCCTEPWVAEYARRVRVVTRIYLQHGRGRVFWATLPLPKTAARQEIAVAVNTAIRRALEGAAGVTVPRFDLLFSPNGYTDVIRYRGHDELVRHVDGMHLNVRGQAIAADAFAKLIRAQPA